jgi:RNA polymerase sigma factor (sigma-70 family)
LNRTQLEADYHRLLIDYGPALSRIASSYEGVPSRQEELRQDILLALWKALPQFRGDCSERTFLFRIAHNRGLHHVWRRKASAGIQEEPETAHELEDLRPTPEAKAYESQRRERLVAAIRRLPVSLRQVIALTLEDLPQSEIALVLGISENNVAVRLVRARKALQEALRGLQ